MTELHHYKDGPKACYANIRMDNGDPCFISVAQTGILVKKSKTGMFGAKLYEVKNVHEAAMAAKAVQYLYPERLTPPDIKNLALNAFTNAVLHCSTLAEVTRVLNSAVKKAEEKSGQPIDTLLVMPG